MRWLLIATCAAGCTEQVSSLSIEPADASLEIVNGVITTADFTVVGVRADGSQVAIDGVTWSVTDPRVGAIDGSGHYTPTGSLGGTIAVTAESTGVTANASLVVKLHIIDPGNTLDPLLEDALHAASSALVDQPASQDPAVAWAYPYDDTVFPRGLVAPEMMWTGAVTGDWYFIHLTSTTYELETYMHLIPAIDGTIPPNRFALDDARWSQLTESTTGNVDVAIARASGGVTTGVIRHHWTIAPAPLPGTIYYWTLESETGAKTGRLRSLPLGARAAVDAIGSYRPTGAESCPKCHTPSADGRHLVLTMIDDTNGQATESIDYDLLTGATSFAGYPTTGTWGDAAVSAHGEVIVQSFAGIRGTLSIGLTSGAFDPTTGASIADTGLESVRAWMPAFSPDDQLFVYVDETPVPGGCNWATGQGAVDGVTLKSCSADLRAFDWDPAAKRATNGRLLVAKGSDPTRDVLQYPTVSPDHATIVYARGSEIGSFSHIDNTQIAGDLFAVQTAAPGSEVALDRLAGHGYPFAAGDRDRDLDYDPSLAPIAAGGYAWVVFESRRSYGNILTGTPFVGQGVGVKQLWIAAIDLAAPPGVDPSHAAFWLPGQDISPTDTSVINMRARWTLSPCGDGDDCVRLP